MLAGVDAAICANGGVGSVMLKRLARLFGFCGHEWEWDSTWTPPEHQGAAIAICRWCGVKRPLGQVKIRVE